MIRKDFYKIFNHVITRMHMRILFIFTSYLQCIHRPFACKTAFARLLIDLIEHEHDPLLSPPIYPQFFGKLLFQNGW